MENEAVIAPTADVSIASPPDLLVTTENAPVSSTHIAGRDTLAELVHDVDNNSSSKSNPEEETQEDVVLEDDS
eukprot:2180161-Ditylum_brightwellii.AAC.1